MRDSIHALAVLLLTMAAATAAEEPTPGWRMFRGDVQCQGIAHGRLADKLSIRWRFETTEAFMSTAAISGGVVYVGCDDGYLYALDLANGKLKWKYQAQGAVQSSPTIVGGVVLAGDDDGVLHAVDVQTGRRKWTYASEAQIISSPIVIGERVIFGSYDAFVYCLNVADGKLLWKYETAGRVHGSPCLAEGCVMVAGCDEYLHVVHIADGTMQRQVSMESVAGTSAAIVGDEVFVGTYSNQVRCINWKTGATKWIFEPEDKSFPFMSSAAVCSTAVILGGRDRNVWALNPADGKVLWRFAARGRVDSSPVIVQNRVFVGSSDGNLYGLDLLTGKEQIKFELGGPITASPAVGEGCLVIGNQDGVLYCFHSGNKTPSK